jgi:hypothetical protein
VKRTPSEKSDQSFAASRSSSPPGAPHDEWTRRFDEEFPGVREQMRTDLRWGRWDSFLKALQESPAFREMIYHALEDPFSLQEEQQRKARIKQNWKAPSLRSIQTISECSSVAKPAWQRLQIFTCTSSVNTLTRPT